MKLNKIKEKTQQVWNSPQGKMARGVSGIVGGVTTASGGGLVGGFLKSHHMMNQAKYIGRKQAEMGLKLFEEGRKSL